MDREEVERKVAETWDAMARGYDRFVSEEGSYARMIERPAIVELLPDVSGKGVLDLGSGGGAYALEFARRGGRVTGVDISGESVRLAREKADREGLRVEFLQGSISDLGFLGARRFDLIFSSAAMHYVADVGETFARVALLLNEGGVFLFSVIHPFYTAMYPLHDYSDADQFATYQLRYFNHALREYIPPWARYTPVERLMCYHHTLDDYFNALRDAGFCVDRIVEPRPLPEWKGTHPRRYYETMNTPLFMIFRCVRREGC